MESNLDDNCHFRGGTKVEVSAGEYFGRQVLLPRVSVQQQKLILLVMDMHTFVQKYI